MRPRFASILLAAVPLLAQKPCECIDKGDIKERLKLASAAIQAYGKEIGTTGLSPYSPKLRVALQARVNSAMAAARTPGRMSTASSGGTSNFCQIEDVHAPTKCLEAAIRAHEKVHQDACLATRDQTTSAILSGKAADRFEALHMTMAGYMVEEVTGYQAEIQFLTRELARLEKDCQPPPPKRHYTPVHGDEGPAAPPPAQDHGNPRPITAPPMVKPKPLPTPKPID